MIRLTLEKVLEKIDEYLCLMEAQQWKKDYKEMLHKINFIPSKNSQNRGTCTFKGKKYNLLLSRDEPTSYDKPNNIIILNIKDLREEDIEGVMNQLFHEVNHVELNKTKGPLSNQRYLHSISKTNPELEQNPFHYDEEKDDEIKRLRDLAKKEKIKDKELLKKRRRNQYLTDVEKARLARIDLTNATQKISGEAHRNTRYVNQDEIEADIGAADDLDMMGKNGKEIVKKSLQYNLDKAKKEYMKNKIYINEAIQNLLDREDLTRDEIAVLKAGDLYVNKSFNEIKNELMGNEMRRHHYVEFKRMLKDKNSLLNKEIKKVLEKGPSTVDYTELKTIVDSRIKAIEEIEKRNIDTKPYTQYGKR